MNIKQKFLLLALGAFSFPLLAGETLYYYHNDHLGTPQMMTDENQTVVWKADYSPFGEAIIDTSVTTIENNLRFPGQYYDKESGLHYNYFRDYDPRIGRYVQSDPIGLRGGNNTYAYVGGNPVNYIDPTGLANITVFGGGEIPFVGGADLGLLATTDPIDIGLFVQIAKSAGGHMQGALGRMTFGAGFESGNRCNFDGMGADLAFGLEGIGGTLNFDTGTSSNMPTGGSIRLGPQLGLEGHITGTASFTARDLGRLIAGMVHGFQGGPVVGEGCECR